MDETYAAYLDRVRAQRAELGDMEKRARDALYASLAEFVLEGLHVENRLNKTRRSGEFVFRR